VLFDRATTGAGATAVWTLNGPSLSATAGGYRIDAASEALDVLPVHPASVNGQIVDWTTDADMTGGARLDVTDATAAGDARFLFVLAPAGTLATATAVGAGSEIGVSLDYVSGAHAEILFDRDVAGAAIQYLDPSSTVLFDGALGAGVDELPLLAEP
jgi:hypothetical protein